MKFTIKSYTAIDNLEYYNKKYFFSYDIKYIQHIYKSSKSIRQTL